METQIWDKLCDLYITIGQPEGALINRLNRLLETINNAPPNGIGSLFDVDREVIEDLKDHVNRLRSHDFSRIEDLTFFKGKISKTPPSLMRIMGRFTLMISGIIFNKVITAIINKYGLVIDPPIERNKKFINKIQLDKLLPDNREELDLIFTRYLSNKGIKYIIPKIPLTPYQDDLYKKIHKLDTSIHNNKELLSEFELIALEKKKEKLASEFISSLINHQDK